MTERDDRHARELADELARHPDDPRFRGRRPGVRAPRKVSREDADADTAGIVGGTGTSGGGGPHAGADFGRTEGRPPPDTPPDDDLDDTVFGSEPGPPER
ncbi:hypothetical protein Acsp03_27100 [Actinomadura sp. NBRC 104412]|uniref:hypothetical protein n=1 Tax=Actinomadura sp. NBRC 104412 TaxID=3032203 RepID=UPI0024A10249|nr:hypothetical protein [Actinomadura sp. NBRC 104412]GLZ05244.1 hypothetical protein Acsp03_27100 [Actinomadura sp. NBRC 104412]